MRQKSVNRFIQVATLLILCVFMDSFHTVSAAELEQMRQTLDELLTRYTEKHPEVIMLRGRINDLEKSQSRKQYGDGVMPYSSNNLQGPAVKTPSKEVSQAHFVFDKQGPLISRPNGMPTGPYWPTLIKMDEVKGFPYEYALYFSTDHSGKGGIWLYVMQWRSN